MLTKKSSKEQAKVNSENSRRPQPYTNNCIGSQGKLETGGVAFFRKSAIGCIVPNDQLKTFIQVTCYRLRYIQATYMALFVYICVYIFIYTNAYIHIYTQINTNIHAIKINEKGGHEFQRDQGEVCGRVCREEREGTNVVIKLQSQKINKF